MESFCRYGMNSRVRSDIAVNYLIILMQYLKMFNFNNDGGKKNCHFIPGDPIVCRGNGLGKNLFKDRNIEKRNNPFYEILHRL